MLVRAIGPVVLLLLLSLSCGCATIWRGNKQTVEVITDPPGATIQVDKKMYVTPAKVLVKRLA